MHVADTSIFNEPDALAANPSFSKSIVVTEGREEGKGRGAPSIAEHETSPAAS